MRPSSIFWNRRGIPGNTQSLPSKRTTGYKADLSGCTRLTMRDIAHTTQISLSVYNTSAFSGKRAMRILAARCSSFCFSISGHLCLIWLIRRNVSSWCLRGWLNALESEAYVMSDSTTTQDHLMYQPQEDMNAPSCVGPIPPDVITKS